MGAPKFLVQRYPPQEPKHRPRIFPGDTFPVVYEARAIDLENVGNVHGEPEVVNAGTARVFNQDTSTWVELSPGETEVDVEITPPNGDVGALLSYTVPATVTVEGEYLIYVKGVFPDGEVYTLSRRFQVQEFGRT
jgi:hypothetical protein